MYSYIYIYIYIYHRERERCALDWSPVSQILICRTPILDSALGHIGCSLQGGAVGGGCSGWGQYHIITQLTI